MLNEQRNIADKFISIGDFIKQVRSEVPEAPGQSQYLARYLTLMPGYEDLGDGLRIKGNTSTKPRNELDYYEVRIHQDDLPTLIKRLKKHYEVNNV
jgi:hypothetical protein